MLDTLLSIKKDTDKHKLCASDAVLYTYKHNLPALVTFA